MLTSSLHLHSGDSNLSNNDSHGLQDTAGVEELEDCAEAAEAHVTHIPVWIGSGLGQSGRRRKRTVVSGVTRMTTCQDIIDAVLQSSQRHLHRGHSSQFYLVEKWKKIDRKLDPAERILDLFEAWGSKCPEVSFTLKQKSASSDPLYEHLKNGAKTKTRTALPDDLLESSPRKYALKHLVLEVMLQRQTIKNQLLKLQKKEQQITDYKTRFNQVQKQKSQVQPIKMFKHPDQSKMFKQNEKVSDCAESSLCRTFQDPDELELTVQIRHLNQKLKREKKRFLELVQKLDEDDQSSSSESDQWEAGKLEEAEFELSRIKQLTEQQSLEIEQNEKLLNSIELSLDSKQELLAQITQQLHSEESQFQNILQKFNAREREPPDFENFEIVDDVTTKFKSLCIVAAPSSTNSNFVRNLGHCLVAKNPRADENDSNSDSGKSSLHSSNDDDNSNFLTHLLNTLV